MRLLLHCWSYLPRLGVAVVEWRQHRPYDATAPPNTPLSGRGGGDILRTLACPAVHYSGWLGATASRHYGDPYRQRGRRYDGIRGQEVTGCRAQLGGRLDQAAEWQQRRAGRHEAEPELSGLGVAPAIEPHRPDPVLRQPTAPLHRDRRTKSWTAAG
jgi:hypothetical protein